MVLVLRGGEKREMWNERQEYLGTQCFHRKQGMICSWKQLLELDVAWNMSGSRDLSGVKCKMRKKDSMPYSDPQPGPIHKKRCRIGGHSLSLNDMKGLGTHTGSSWVHPFVQQVFKVMTALKKWTYNWFLKCHRHSSAYGTCPHSLAPTHSSHQPTCLRLLLLPI